MVCLGFEPTAADDRRRQNHGAMGAALKSFNILYNIDRIEYISLDDCAHF